MLKGVETDLPDGYIFTDSYGIKRESVRAKWWINDSIPLNQAVIDTGVVDHITEHVNGDDFPGYHHNEKPCFVGHYWWNGDPEPISHNIACLDYSVAKNGKLVAYRWQGEEQLTKDHFCWV